MDEKIKKHIEKLLKPLIKKAADEYQLLINENGKTERKSANKLAELSAIYDLL